MDLLARLHERTPPSGAALASLWLLYFAALWWLSPQVALAGTLALVPLVATAWRGGWRVGAVAAALNAAVYPYVARQEPVAGVAWWAGGSVLAAFSVGMAGVLGGQAVGTLQSIRKRSLVLAQQTIALARAKEDLQHRVDYFEVLFRAAPAGLVALDEAGRVTRWSPGAEHIFGWEHEEMEGETLERLLSQQPDDAAQRFLAATLTGDPATTLHSRMSRRDGTPLDVAVQHAALLDPHGTKHGTMAIITDVSERRELERQQLRDLERTREIERLRDMDRFKTRFLNMAAHELSTPLTPIKLQLASLVEDADTMEEPLRDGLALMSRNVDRLERLVRDLLDTTRVQGDQLALDAKPLEMEFVVRDAVDSFAQQARLAGIELSADIGPGLPVTGDPVRLGQVCFNLIHNAVKFTPPGGRVHIEARHQGSDILVLVRDTGPGLSQEQLGGLFEPFAQFHRDQVGSGVGTGLGLYISRGIVVSHGGQLRAASGGPGEGATFSFTVPSR